MKKSNLLLATFLSLTLVSCNSVSKDKTFNIKEWSTDLIDQNLLEDEKFEYRKANYDGYKQESFNVEDIYDKKYQSYGLLVIKMDNDKMGFYSLIKNNWVVTISSWSSSYVYYDVKTINEIGFILEVKANDIYYGYDGFGNQLYFEFKYKPSVSFIEEDDRIGVSIDGVINFYDENGSLYLAENKDNKLESGNKFVDPDLSDFFDEIKNEGYQFSVSANEMIIVYNDEGEYMSSYALPFTLKDASSLYFAGTSLIYQVDHIVPDDAKDYDVYIEYKNDEYYKVILNHYKLDLLTGKNKMINLDYYLYSEGGTIYNDKKGNPSYSLAYLAFIGEDKTTKEYGEYLLDENGKVLANATGFYPDCFIKLDNGNYYNTATDILYDSKLNVIANLYSIRPSYFKGIGFIGRDDGKYGVVGEDGYIKVSFEYDLIDLYLSSNCVTAVKNNVVYRINLNTGYVETIANKNDVTMCGGGLLIVKANDNSSICSASKTLYSTTKRIQFITWYGTYFGNYYVFAANNNSTVEYLTFVNK